LQGVYINILKNDHASFSTKKSLSAISHEPTAISKAQKVCCFYGIKEAYSRLGCPLTMKLFKHLLLITLFIFMP